MTNVTNEMERLAKIIDKKAAVYNDVVTQIKYLREDLDYCETVLEEQEILETLREYGYEQEEAYDDFLAAYNELEAVAKKQGIVTSVETYDEKIYFLNLGEELWLIG